MDEFGLHAEQTALRDLIDAEIRRAGRMTFRRFMDLALYHPEQGYYAARDEVIGPRGDYLTSPELSPLFGAMIGRQAVEVWRLMDRPARFDLVEAGPGNGTLAQDLLRWCARAAPDFSSALTYTLVERSPTHRSRAARLLADQPNVRWSEALPPEISGVIFSNELLDAFPVHVVAVAGSDLSEVYVGLHDGGLVEETGPPSTPAIGAYFAALGLRPGEGCRAEVNLDAPTWISSAARALRRGLVLTLDYGYPARTLYAPWRRQGTLMCFHRHTANDEPLLRVGRQDITTHVDFTSVARAGLDAGLALAGFVAQYELLSNLGIRDALRSTAGDEYVARYRAVQDLLQPEGLGRVRALALTRGIDGPCLTGFAGAADPYAALFGV